MHVCNIPYITLHAGTLTLTGLYYCRNVTSLRKMYPRSAFYKHTRTKTRHFNVQTVIQQYLHTMGYETIFLFLSRNN